MNRAIRNLAGRFALLAFGLSLACALLASRPAAAVETWTNCTPANVMVAAANTKRIHVKCAQAVNGVRYYALNNTDAALMARVLTLLTSAQIAGRTLSVLNDPADLSGQAWGCANSDCRILRAVSLGQ